MKLPVHAAGKGHGHGCPAPGPAERQAAQCLGHIVAAFGLHRVGLADESEGTPRGVECAATPTHLLAGSALVIPDESAFAIS